MVVADRQVAVKDVGATLEKVVVQGDLRELSPGDRVMYYNKVCSSLGLNPLTMPLQYITLSGRLTLYVTRGAGDQLRKLHGVSIEKPDVRVEDGLCIVAVTARTPDGRTDSELGVVAVENLKGEARANAILKAITKAKRRVTLSIVGLGWLDESEVDSIPNAQVLTAAEALAEPSTAGHPDEVPICADCGKPVGRRILKDGTHISAQEAAQRSLDNVGRALCLPCLRAEIARQEAIRAAEPKPEEQAF